MAVKARLIKNNYKYSLAPHLYSVLRGPAHRQEVGHDVGHQVSAHFYSRVKVILK